MTPASSYDAVFVGTQLAPLVSAALLAKRGFRVLLVAQDELPPTYAATPTIQLPPRALHLRPRRRSHRAPRA
ncbi:MAG: hypothetical protein M5U28_07280 [Sandaracinaceae bacterium]|nr:hypothetical protein [Sandaracinaceae bacterium]